MLNYPLKEGGEMAAQVLYRKWRSQTFDELIGQEHVVRTLKNALKAGRISHAYLFAGPRGTGKTTTARLVAKAVNCLSEDEEKPCNRCEVCVAINEGRCLDLIEIDAASNRGIDEIRDLREKVNFRPAQARYKVYVIDEVHMLTNEAFNALLKTLEEPPDHVIFILATTAPDRIPATVLSRCQRFDFHRIPVKDIVARMDYIASQEGIEITPEALTYIARQAIGSLRDALSLLDQLRSYGEGPITVELVQSVLGSVSPETIADLVDLLLEGRAAEGIAFIDELLDKGADPRQVTREFLNYLRSVLLVKVSGRKAPVDITPDVLDRLEEQARRFPLRYWMKLIRIFNQTAADMKVGLAPQLALEMAFVEALEEQKEVQEKAVAPVEAKPTPAPRSAGPAPKAPERKPKPTAAQEPRDAVERKPAPEIPPPSPQDLPPSALETLRTRWAQVLALVRPRDKNVEAFLRSCEPVSVEGNVVTLGFYYSFHKEQMEQENNRTLVEEVLGQFLGVAVRVRCTVTPKGKARSRSAKVEDPVIQAAVKQLGAVVREV